MDASRKNMVFNLLSGFLCGYGFVAFFLFLYCDQQWHQSAPEMVDTFRGLIYMHNIHGSIRYFSAFQATACYLFFFTSIPLVFIGAFLQPKKNIRDYVGRLSMRVTYDHDDPKRLMRWGALAGCIAAPAIIYFLGAALVHWLNAQDVVLNSG